MSSTTECEDMSAIGIDFGNASSFVAVVKSNGIQMIENDHRLRATPSYLAFGERHRLVGVAAKKAHLTNLPNTIFDFKRYLGQHFDNGRVQEDLPLVPFKIVNSGHGRVGIQVKYLGEDKIFTPEQLTAMLFTTLKEMAENHLKAKVHHCVISVPSYFADYERRAVLAAAEIAGLHPLRLMNDTTAAALNYGVSQMRDLPELGEVPRFIAIVDCGYSAFQVSICALNKGKLRQMSQTASELPVDIAYVLTGDEKDTVERTISRATFENVCATFLMTWNLPCLDAEHIHSVELVGGASRIPAIKRLVTRVFRKSPSKTLDIDEAVARGCALQSAILSPFPGSSSVISWNYDIIETQPYRIELQWKLPSGQLGQHRQSNHSEAVGLNPTEVISIREMTSDEEEMEGSTPPSTSPDTRDHRDTNLTIDVQLEIRPTNELPRSEQKEDERQERRTQLEKYLQDVRERLDGDLKSFAGEGRNELNEYLSQLEDWVYHENIDPIMVRDALHRFREALSAARNFVYSYHARLPEYVHLDENDVENVTKAIERCETWLALDEQCSPPEAPNNNNEGVKLRSLKIEEQRLIFDAKIQSILNDLSLSPN
ncbi:97 kDa heat shock protein, partial [Orchesella cincta]